MTVTPIYGRNFFKINNFITKKEKKALPVLYEAKATRRPGSRVTKSGNR